MKAVVVELRGKKAAVLSSNGQVKLVSNRSYAKGQVIEIREDAVFGFSSGKKYASALAAAVLVMVLGVSSFAYFTPVSTVSLDVNPSLLFNLNRFERVLSVQGIGDAGQQIANQIQTKNKSVDDAIMLALQQMKQSGFLGESEQNGIMISASFKNAGQEQAFAARLRAMVEGDLTELDVEAEVEAEGVGYARVIEARELDMTPGKLNLIEKLQGSVEDAKTYDIGIWRDKSVKEIMQAIKDNRMKEKGLTPGQDNPDEDSDDNGDSAPGGKPEGLPGKGNTNNNGKGN
ncbi:MAG TPA: hypothetical protein VK905_03335 [Bacillota bacterium]|nr:hypothetical protein [Bacillota bacterium]